ncbi:MAG TPA: response regulator [Ktedonobacteraceae bacterium]|jgi:YesN/AraC family two-component response regulator|nr:response regulator [Ktedonobacteraceae bacterium]
MDTPSILLVDDDPSLLKALPQMILLRLPRVETATASSGYQALELLEEHEYDTIISDIKMPGMDGLELLEKTAVLHPETPTMLITGHGDQSLVTQALRAGAYDFIQKPIDRVYFVAALQRALHTRHLRGQVRQQHQELERYAKALEHLIEQRTREFMAANSVMELLVRDALDLSLAASHALLVHRQRCDLVEVCQQVLAAYISEAGRTLDFEVGREPVEVEIDRERISQVLIHLLFMARTSSPGGAPLKVMLTQTSTEAIVTIQAMEVEELAEHPLERFYRREPADGQKPFESEGGAGLFLVQHLVTQHEGQIQISTDAQRRNGISLRLPLAAPLAESISTPFQPPRWLLS